MIQKKSKYFYILPAITFILVVFFIPLIYALVISFARWNLLRPDLGITFIGFKNYGKLFSDSFTWQVFLQTIYFVVGAVLLELVAGIIIALALNTEFKGWKVVQSIILIPFMIAPVVVGFVWRFILNPDFGPITHFLISIGFKGLTENPLLTNPKAVIPILILADAWEFIPFVVLVILAGLKSISREPYEAAIADGANSFQMFFYITLPLLRPSILVAVVIRTLTSLRVFDIVYIMTGGGPGSASETLAFYGYRMAFQSYKMGYSSTINIFIFGIAIVFTVVYMKIIGWGGNDEK